MATSTDTRQSDSPTEQTHRIDLRDLGADRLPDAAAACEVTVVGDVRSTAELRVDLVDTTWVVGVVLRAGELEGVYDETGPAPKPNITPDWLEAACACVGVDEVTV